MAATWDMITSGPERGTLVRPPRYTATEEDATRVRVWLQLATPLGSYILGTTQGLDHERMLSPEASDDERAAYVRAIVLADPGVAELIGEPVVALDGVALDVSATFRTTTGVVVSIGE